MYIILLNLSSSSLTSPNHCNLRSVKRRSFQNLGDVRCDVDNILYNKCVSLQDIKISISLVYRLEPLHGTKSATYKI